MTAAQAQALPTMFSMLHTRFIGKLRYLHRPGLNLRVEGPR